MDALVMPGRINPSSGGVISSFSRNNIKPIFLDIQPASIFSIYSTDCNRSKAYSKMFAIPYFEQNT
jgi:hypothetical protein